MTTPIFRPRIALDLVVETDGLRYHRTAYSRLETAGVTRITSSRAA